MKAIQATLKNSQTLVIRQAMAEDAPAILEYIAGISGESDFLTFGPGEFELTQAGEEEFLHKCAASDNQVYMLGLIDDKIVASLNFAGGRRPRLRHSGEIGMSVRKAY